MQMKSLLWAATLCLFSLEIVCFAQNNQSAGFISIDCGLAEGIIYKDNKTGINYTSDSTFINAGEIRNIPTNYAGEDSDRQLRTIRSFPNGNRNCYNLSKGIAGESKGKSYLIRAIFMYGNYDSRNQIPKFDLHIGVEFWTSVEPRASDDVVMKEIIHVPSSNYLYLCLVDTGNGKPFISAIEVRGMNEMVYPTSDSRQSLSFAYRYNYAPINNSQEVIRYPDDVYDRMWYPPPSNTWRAINTTSTINQNNIHQPPIIVMRSAIKASSDMENIDIFPGGDPNTLFHTYLHFAELEQLPNSQTRQIVIYINGRWISTLRPRYLVTDTVYDAGGITGSTVPNNFSLVRPENSNLPPFINAMEMYRVVPFLQSQTEESNVRAIVNIQSTYGIKRSNWQGDPCLPKVYMWEGLGCIVSDDKSIAPTIKDLNLSSSGLSGNLSLVISELTSLENLDLSNNNLTGPIPEFLAEIRSLKVLNLTGNKFDGSIPQKLIDRGNNGLLLRIEGYETNCESGEGSNCNKNKSKKLIIALVTSLVGCLIILAALIVFWRLRRTKNQVKKLDSVSKDGILESKNIRLTYSQILEITNNFERVLGKGGFGTVYHGFHAGIEVAVKILSPSSVQGYREFQTEAELLTRVHHRNLTSLVGYCYDDDKMALVYEYMANGNLRELLSDERTSTLSWLGRLHIALDAAQGLDYLHNGCKPPIIHRDIKSTNILLNEKFEAKLADFGLSRAFSAEDGSFVSTKVVGTIGYVDPEYYESNRLHEKSDIYSLGIVFLELITGKSAVFRDDEDERRHLSHWVNLLVVTGDIERIVDGRLEDDYAVNSAWKALELGMACSSPSSSKRPTMGHVLKELTECLSAEESRIKERQRLVVNTEERDLADVNLMSSDTQLGPR